MKASLLSVYLFSSMPSSLKNHYAKNPQVRRLAETRSDMHLLVGYIIAASKPPQDRTLYDVVLAYVYLVALRMRGYTKPVPYCTIDWSRYI